MDIKNFTKTILTIIMATIVAFSMCGANAFAAATTYKITPAATGTVKVTTATTYASKPNIVAKGAIAYCGETGQILYGKNINTALDPYSITKMMTCYITMKYVSEGKLSLDDEVTVSSYAAKQMESKLYLLVGEKIKVRYLLYGALLHSGNDAAAALGEKIAGDNDSFAKMMNKEAKALGCTNSHFVNTNGVKVSGHYTTAHDMALILQAATKYKYIQQICQTKSYTVPADNKSDAFLVCTTNPFFYKEKKIKKPYKYYNIIAGKTGTWDTDDASLIEASRYNGKTIYTVVIGDTSAQRYSDTVKLIEYGRSALDSIAYVESDSKVSGVEKEAGTQSWFEKAVDKIFPDAIYEFFYGSTESTTVKGVMAKVKGGSTVTLSWQKVSGADGYKVYRATSGKYKLIKKIKSGSVVTYTDPNSGSNKTYYYFVKSYSCKDGLFNKNED